MNRRDFLKTLCGFFAGLAGLYLMRVFSVFTKGPHNNPSALKKAKFYRRSDHLAG